MTLLMQPWSTCSELGRRDLRVVAQETCDFDASDLSVESFRHLLRSRRPGRRGYESEQRRERRDTGRLQQVQVLDLIIFLQQCDDVRGVRLRFVRSVSSARA